MSGPVITNSTQPPAPQSKPEGWLAGTTGRFEVTRPITPLPARKLTTVSAASRPQALSPPGATEKNTMPLTPPVTLRPPPRHSVLKRIGKFARRVTYLAMDATLILLFAPVIAGWLLVERRRRRLQ